MGGESYWLLLFRGYARKSDLRQEHPYHPSGGWLLVSLLRSDGRV